MPHRDGEYAFLGHFGLRIPAKPLIRKGDDGCADISNNPDAAWPLAAMAMLGGHQATATISDV